MQYPLNLTAGRPARIDYGGRFLMILDTGAATSLALKIRINGANDEEISEAKRGFKLSLPSGRFDRIEFVSAVNTSAKVLVSDQDLNIDFAEGAAVNATIVGTPVQVQNDRGAPGNLLYVAGVSLADAPATAATAAAPIAVTSAGVVLAAANANTRAIRFCNLGPDPVAIGPAGATWAQRVVVMETGDAWIEDRGGNLAWSGITDAGKTASVTVQRVNA